MGWSEWWHMITKLGKWSEHCGWESCNMLWNVQLVQSKKITYKRPNTIRALQCDLGEPYLFSQMSKNDNTPAVVPWVPELSCEPSRALISYILFSNQSSFSLISLLPLTCFPSSLFCVGPNPHLHQLSSDVWAEKNLRFAIPQWDPCAEVLWTQPGDFLHSLFSPVTFCT